MILKTAANYNDEGGYIEAWKKSDGTTEVKLIPKSGGGDDGKNGIKSVSISPAITTTPALDSLLPIYWEDLTEEQKQDGLDVTLTAPNLPAGEYTVTVMPTDDWYARVGETMGNEKGASVSVPFIIESGATLAILPNMFALSNIPQEDEPEQYFAVAMAISKQ